MMKLRGFCILLFLFIPLVALGKTPALLQVSFLDIGQGDSIYIQAPNGNQMIIDGGPKDALMRVLPTVMPFGDRSIDVLMVTNPDADHFSGFIPLLQNYTIGAVIESGTKSTTPTYRALLEQIEKKKIPDLVARKGMTITLDAENGVVFRVLFPDQDVSGWSRNDGSIMGILTYRTTKIFFTGDGTKTTENAVMLRTDADVLKSTILKVGHHGSRTSTSDAFVKAIAPIFAVISDGKGNTYGHPHEETLATLATYGVEVHRTDLESTVTFVSDGHILTKK